jgi:hypothetical protein
MSDTPPRPTHLLKAMTEEQRQQAAIAFWEDEQSLAEQAEVVGLIARQINFRAKSVVALPTERKAKHLLRMGRVSDLVAGRMLVTYHLAHQRPMMAAFLDALGIGHEDGLITEENVTPPDAGTLGEAARTLAERFPPADVRLYFSTLLLQDADTWGSLRDHLPEPGRVAADAPEPPAPEE